VSVLWHACGENVFLLFSSFNASDINNLCSRTDATYDDKVCTHAKAI